MRSRADSRGGAARRSGRAVLLGVIALGLAIAIAELVSAVAVWRGLLTSSSSPVLSLGSAVIDLSPAPVVEWAKRTFGAPGDKIALGVGIAVVMVAAGAAVGALARVRRAAGMTVAVLLVLVAGWAVEARADAGPGELIPLTVGAVVGIWYLAVAFGDRSRAADGALAAASLAAVAEPESRNDGADAREPDGARPGASDDDASGRRRFLRLAGYGALGVAASAVLSRVVPTESAVDASRDAVQLPTLSGATSGVSSAATAPPSTGVLAGSAPAVIGTLDAVPGIARYVTPNSDFYRIDTAFSVPQVTTDEWRLRVHGMVDHDVELTFADLQSRQMVERYITLACVSNPVGGDLVGNALWQGTHIADILAEAGVQPGADCVLSTDVKGFTVTTPLEALTDGRDALLAIGMNGEPLPLEHGFPVRMVVPGLYGYVSATKWIADMEVTRFEDVSAFWTNLGWAAQAPVKTSSRIDVPGSSTVDAGAVTVAGVAWAQHRGIDAVQVQVRRGSDDWGPWRDAELSRPVSADTWVQWRYDWDAEPGDYTVRCRAIDGTGTAQIGADSDVIPDGATGYHHVQVTVVAS